MGMKLAGDAPGVILHVKVSVLNREPMGMKLCFSSIEET